MKFCDSCMVPRIFFVVFFLVSGEGSSLSPALGSEPRLGFLSFSSLRGWTDDNQLEALRVFSSSCSHLVARIKKRPAVRTLWRRVCREAGAVPAVNAAARFFFEQNFRPYRVYSNRGKQGFFTGYYEPEVNGSLVPNNNFHVPIYRPPRDLVSLRGKKRPVNLSDILTSARRVGEHLFPYYTRQEIEQGALVGDALELVWLRDKVTAFFIHIQGSSRVRLADGRILRLSFAGKNGHPYTSVGNVIRKLYDIPPSDLTADVLRQWLKDRPHEADRLMWKNESFVFFNSALLRDFESGPIGAMNIALTARRSLAVDHKLYDLGIPVWIETQAPEVGTSFSSPFHHLMIAQDTGAAIVGPARGDIFFGSGEAAGHHASVIRYPGAFVILLPHGLPLPKWAGK